MTSLRDKTISGIFWSFLQKVGSRGVTFIVMLLLARLLTPKDFGLIGMLMIFIQVSQAFVDGGFNLALIQKKDTDEEDYSSVFYINLVVSSLLYLVLFFTAPFIAAFYRQPLLTSLMRVLSLVFVVNAFSFVQEARLTKAVRFKTLMLIHIPSNFIGGVISIVMAFLGYGVWSIVVFQLLQRLAYTIQIWLYSRWKPKLSFNISKAKSLFSFGSKLLIARIIGVIYNNLFLVVIGKFFPISSVGYYQNAFNVTSTPSNTITTVLNGVTFPIFSSIQDDNKRLKEGYKRAMQQALFWVCPFYVISGILADPLFRFLFTEKWLPAVPFFQWLCIVGIFNPLNVYNLDILNIKGRSDIFLKLQIVRRSITIVGIMIVLPFGIMELLILQAVSEVLTFILFVFYSGKFIDYRISEQLKDILPIFLLNIVIGLGVLFLDHFFESFSDIIRLVIGFSTGISAYLLLTNYFKYAPMLDFINIIQSKVFKKYIS